MVVATVALSADGSSGTTGRLGGDLPSVFGAGRIVAEGDGLDLYEPTRQIESQRGLWEDDASAMLFAYPAVFAIPYAGASALGYQATYLIHTAVMAGALVLTARLLVDRMPLLAGRQWVPLGLAFSLTFLPMFIGVANGQNTALTLLLVVGAWALLSDGRDVGAGVVVGLASMKPQYGLVLIGLLVLGRRWRALAAAAGVVVSLWIGSAIVAGPGWSGRWLHLVASMSDIDGGVNLGNEVSWFGLAELGLGRGTMAAKIVGGLAILATAGLLVRALRKLDVSNPMVPAILAPSLLLIAPHALYYDAGILVVALAALLPTVLSGRRGWVVGLWWAAGFGHVISGRIGIEPVGAVVIGTWLWALWVLRPGSEVPEPALMGSSGDGAPEPAGA